VTLYDPERWLETTVRCLKEYLEENFNKALTDGDEYVGLQVYEIVAEFPGPDLDLRKMPMDKTIIHFEIDDIQSGLLGFGDGIVDYLFDDASGSVAGRTGEIHLINLDVGIWASDRSGGVTARSRAKQILHNCLGSAASITRLRDFSSNGDGELELLGFTGGRFVPDRINDMPVHRMIECTLILRVFSRVPLEDTQYGPMILEIAVDPDMQINDEGVLVEVNGDDGAVLLPPTP
jgi:hypothetical protein